MLAALGCGKKLISVLDVLGQNMILLYQAGGWDVSYYLGVVPYRIGISVEVTNFIGVCNS